MLPRELLDARRSRGRIYLNFASDEHLKLAKAVLIAFKSSIGQSYAELQEKLRHLETASNYKKVRGFAKIIERECKFSMATNLDPWEVRKFLFERGYVTSEFDRIKVLREAAEHFGASIEEIERAIFADREEEKILEEVPEINPEELIKRYNLSLLQTLMFEAVRLTFKVSSNYKEILRGVKKLGLMYEVIDEGIEVTGPASLLKLTRKYGTSIAKLIPGIVKAEEWWMRAEVVEDKRIYIFELSSEESVMLPKIMERIEYSSSLEREFASKIKRILGVDVIYEPEIIKVGNYAYIPDFLIKKGNKKVYVEIVGFWTRDYLKRKLEKISKAKIQMLLIVNDELFAEKASRFSGKEVLLMKKGKIPYKDVIMKIKEMLKS
ncbi:DUF790 family protein [Pyrococcus horikoshii]|uniref:Uncharacterized protein n=2 Tax=Pyrococcus horikoshii TaxID=53953 RepID=O58176_PYRHO|nr:DUF790 family protein [Pyrococcus horikoshii]BAA29535.1 378aa long hypothetical protein [Pyrococcus horikoshii OT3]HII60964.1 DUF790 family protein [Pyrococcus horikoshii]